MVYLGVVEPFMVKLKVTIFSGLALALPVLLYQLWRFITPALKSGERKFALPFVFASILLFRWAACSPW